MFETPDYFIHSVTLRPDDVVEISFTEKRHMHEWGYKSQLWSFDRTAVKDIELRQLIDSAGELVNLVEVKGRTEPAADDDDGDASEYTRPAGGS